MTAIATPRFQFISTFARAVNLGLAVVVSLTTLACMGRIANHQLDAMQLAQAQGPVPATEVVVVTAHRLPRG